MELQDIVLKISTWVQKYKPLKFITIGPTLPPLCKLLLEGAFNIMSLRARMVIHELSTTEAHTDWSLRDMWRGLIVFLEYEKTHSTSTDAAVTI